MGNAEAMRERILEAASAEFSAYGVAGARVDRIAKVAGCNKNLIYIYFESREALFTTVLNRSLAGVYEALPLTPDDLPGYAARVECNRCNFISRRAALRVRDKQWLHARSATGPKTSRPRPRQLSLHLMPRRQAHPGWPPAARRRRTDNAPEGC